MPARDEFVDEIRADEAGRAGDKTFHNSDKSWTALASMPADNATKIFTSARLTWRAGLEKLPSVVCRSKSTPEKKMNRAEQRDLDTKIEFIEGLVRRDPDYVDALQILGDHYTQRGRFNEGLARWTNASRGSNRKIRSSFTISRAAIR